MITQQFLDLEGGEKSVCTRLYANNVAPSDPRRSEVWQASVTGNGGPWYGFGESPAGATVNALGRRLSLGGPVPVPDDPATEEEPQQ